MRGYIGFREEAFMNLMERYAETNKKLILKNGVRVLNDGTEHLKGGYGRYLRMLSDELDKREVHVRFYKNGRMFDLIRKINRTYGIDKYFYGLRSAETYADLLDALIKGVEQLRDGIDEDSELLNKCDSYEFADAVHAIWYLSEKCLDEMVNLEKEVIDRNYKGWSEKLINPFECSQKDFDAKDVHLLVGAAENMTQMYNHTCGIISCSYLNGEQCRKTYRDRKFGWVFYPKEQDVLSMSPEDSSSAETQMRTEAEVVETVFSEKILSDESKYVTQRYDYGVLPCWDIEKLAKATKDYNEVILRDTAKPVGVFVFKDKFEEMCGTVVSLAEASELPIVVYDGITGKACIRRVNESAWKGGIENWLR